MTKKAVTKAATAEELTPEQRLKVVVTRALEDPDRGVPVLIGPTQYGKTRWVWEILTDMGIERRNIMTINPQNDLPEDISGWPKRDGDYLSFTQPASIRADLVSPENYDANGVPKVRWALFIDEMDKAQEAVLSCFLTLLNPDERRLRHTHISKHVPIIVAMNEPEGRAMPDPLLARMLFLEYPPHGMNISNRPHLRPLENIASELFIDPPVIKFPARPKAPGSLHKLVNWMSIPEFWRDEEIRRMIVRGLFPEAMAGAVLGKLQHKTPNPSKEWAQSVSPMDLVEHLLPVLTAGKYQDRVDVIETLAERCNNSDPTGELTRVFVIFLETPGILFYVDRPKHAENGQKLFRDKVQEYLKQQKEEQKASR
jgi:hypothetical protein